MDQKQNNSHNGEESQTPHSSQATHSSSIPHKKLYRSTTDRIFTGICGGLAEYLNIDSNVLRLVWVLVVIFTGFVPGVLVYFIALAIVPEKFPKAK